MAKPNRVLEITDFVRAHEGPDENGRAHPVLKRVHYEDLCDAIDLVQAEGLCGDVQPYHFENVLGIWTSRNKKQHARDLFSDLIESVLETYPWNMVDFMRGMSNEIFQYHPIPVRSKPNLYITAGSCRAVVHKGNKFAAFKDWLEHHDEKKVRMFAQKVRPWHFGLRVHTGTWQDEENIQEVTEDLVRTVMRKYDFNFTEAIHNIGTTHFLQEQIPVNTPWGILYYNASSMLSIPDEDSAFDALRNWMDNHSLQHIREFAPVFRPWHRGFPVRNLWRDDPKKVHAYEITGELITTLRKIYGWTLTDVVKKITKNHFRDVCIPVKTPDGLITYTAAAMFREVFTDSTSTAVLHWIQNNSDREIRERYQHMQPHHFSKAPKLYWAGENGKLHGRQVVQELIQFGDVDTGEILIPTPDGSITYLGSHRLGRVYKKESLSSGLLDWWKELPPHERQIVEKVGGFSIDNLTEIREALYPATPEVVPDWSLQYVQSLPTPEVLDLPLESYPLMDDPTLMYCAWAEVSSDSPRTLAFDRINESRLGGLSPTEFKFWVLNKQGWPAGKIAQSLFPGTDPMQTIDVVHTTLYEAKMKIAKANRRLEEI